LQFACRVLCSIVRFYCNTLSLIYNIRSEIRSCLVYGFLIQVFILSQIQCQKLRLILFKLFCELIYVVNFKSSRWLKLVLDSGTNTSMWIYFECLTRTANIVRCKSVLKVSLKFMELLKDPANYSPITIYSSQKQKNSVWNFYIVWFTRSAAGLSWISLFYLMLRMLNKNVWFMN